MPGGDLTNEMMSLSSGALRALADESVESKRIMEEMRTRQIVVVTDEDSGDQAAYVDGQFRFCDGTIYACDLGELADGSPVYLSFETVANPESTGEKLNSSGWPDSLEQLKVVFE